MHGAVKVGDGDQRLDTVLVAFFKEIFVEFQASFIWFRLIPLREDTGPGDGEAVGFEAHFTKEGDVFLEMMVHVDGFLGWVEITILKIKHLLAACNDGSAVFTNRHDIHIGQATAVYIVGSFALVGSCCATP